MQVERGAGGEEIIKRTQNKSDITQTICNTKCCHGNHTHYRNKVFHFIGCRGGELHEANVVAIVELRDYINGGEQPVRGRGEERRGKERAEWVHYIT